MVGRPAKGALLPLEMLQALRDGQGTEGRPWLDQGLQARIGMEGFQAGDRNRIEHIQVTGLDIGIGGIEALVVPELQASVPSLARSLV